MRFSLLRLLTSAVVLLSNLSRFEAVRPVFNNPAPTELAVKDAVEDEPLNLSGSGAVNEATAPVEAEEASATQDAAVENVDQAASHPQEPAAAPADVEEVSDDVSPGAAVADPPKYDSHEQETIQTAAVQAEKPQKSEADRSAYKNNFQEFIDHKPVVEEAVKRWHPTLERLQGEVNRATSNLDATAETVSALDHQIVGVKKEISKLGHATHSETRSAAKESVSAFHEYDREGAAGSDKDGRWVPEAGKWDTFKDLIEEGNAKLAQQPNI